MKKMILSAALMMAAFLSQAAIHHALTPLLKSVGAIVHPANEDHQPFGVHPANEDQQFKLCSVTMKGSIDLGAFEVEISCTTSAATCQEATTMALSCIKSAVRTARTILL